MSLYIAPEQAEAVTVSAQTEIYTRGIVLNGMLSDSIPVIASTPSAVLIKQLQEALIWLRKLRREIPSALENIDHARENTAETTRDIDGIGARLAED